MDIPFTTEQFRDVFVAYNTAVYPLQLFFHLLALAAVYFAVKKQPWSDRLIALILSFLWLWMGIVYHIGYFSLINPAAYAFGIGYGLEALLLLRLGLFSNRLSFHFHANGYGWVGILLLLYALILYPSIGYFSGHVYPASATFGLPCPTTIFTFGLLLWTDKKCPAVILFIPFLWSIIGFSAAFVLGMHEDTGLLPAGAGATGMLLFRQLKIRKRHLTTG